MPAWKPATAARSPYRRAEFSVYTWDVPLISVGDTITLIARMSSPIRYRVPGCITGDFTVTGSHINIPIDRSAEVLVFAEPQERAIFWPCEVPPPAMAPADEVRRWERLIHEDPEAAPVYADWCEEHGWPERAQQLRQQ